MNQLHPSQDPNSECYGCEVLQCYMCSSEEKDFYDKDSFYSEPEDVQPKPQRYVQQYKECRNCGEIQAIQYPHLEYDMSKEVKNETDFSSCNYCGCCVGTIFFIVLEDLPFADRRPLEWHEYKKILKNKDVGFKE